MKTTEDRNGFPERLRIAREARDMSQAELGQRVGLQTSAISHFEAGRRAPSFDNLKRLADGLNATADYLLGRSGELDPPGRNAAGPAIDRLLRHANEMTQEQLEVLADLAQVFADRNRFALERSRRPGAACRDVSERAMRLKDEASAAIGGEDPGGSDAHWEEQAQRQTDCRRSDATPGSRPKPERIRR